MEQDSTLAADRAQSQMSLAETLDITVADYPTTALLVAKIEDSLGQNTMLEQSRWFVMSVLCHCNKLPWLELSDCEIPEEKQYALAARFIESDEYKQSLRTVLKEDRCKFTLIRFAKSRNVEKRILSTTTKAFKHAQTLLRGEALLKDAPKVSRKNKSSSKQKKATASGSLVDRRAARRGYFDDEFLDFLNPEGEGFQEAPIAAQMTDEEFSELDAKVNVQGDQLGMQWLDTSVDDRSSLIVGLASGCLLFLIVIWAFV
ncbi:MAG: hypothetical protein AB8B95_05155 [Pseudohongiellaceae bacterium]